MDTPPARLATLGAMGTNLPLCAFNGGPDGETKLFNPWFPIVNLGIAGNTVVAVEEVALLDAMTNLGVVIGDESLGAGAITTDFGGTTVVTVEFADPDQLVEATVALTDGNVR